METTLKQPRAVDAMTVLAPADSRRARSRRRLGTIGVAIASLALALPAPSMAAAAALPAPATAGASGASSGAGAPTTFAGSTMLAASELGWYSANWAGYVVQGGPYTSIGGQWNVPRVSATARSSFSAVWLGIDGVDRPSLIQAGTEQDFYGGTSHYSAWWEVLPEPAVMIRSLSVRPGDRITARIRLVGGTAWRITITDSRSGSFSTTVSYDGGGSSAEWIEESPVVSGRTTRLAVHPAVTFDNVTANGSNPHLLASDAGGLIQRRVLIEVPSAPDSDRNGFTLVESGYRPAPPPS